jgi:predicted TIM-barrel fold metal-dependent hydrolase
MYSRRRFLKSGVALGALAIAGGCRGRLVKPPSCPQYARPDGQVVIDAHCHIFNGSDLQIAGFVNQVGLRQPDLSPLNLIGDIIQALAWELAPTADEELRWLRSRDQGDGLGTGSGEGSLVAPHPLSATLRSVRKDSDMRFVEFWQRLDAFDAGAATRKGLLRANDAEARVDEFFRRLEQGTPRTSADKSARSLRQQLQSPDGVIAALRAEEAGDGRVSAIISFLKTFFRFRIENAWTMLQAYGCDSKTSVDLLCPAMVDFDLWIGDANSNRGRTRSPIDRQMAVMREIALATQGRVHAMAPFNPLRAACDPDTGYIRRAVEEYGCIAFKVYPPMGFRATGNAQITQPALKQCPGSRPVATRPQLDAILHDFYSRCAEIGVPVMAHTSDSNEAYSGSGKLAGPRFWEDVLGSYGREMAAGRSSLRINLGHMGGDHKADEPNDWREQVATAMERFPGQVYTDLSYYEHMMGSADVRRRLAEQMQMVKREFVWPHVMYGSDWSMLAAQPRWRHYIDDFASFLDSDLKLDAPQRAAIMGETALTFYGLREGQPTMERLHKFHDADWRGMGALTERG